MIDWSKIKFVLILLIVAIGSSLYTKWQQQNPVELPKRQENISAHNVPQLESEIISNPEPKIIQDTLPKYADTISIKTDCMDLQISKLGGDIVKLDLLKFGAQKQAEPSERKFKLFDHTKDRYYIAESGLSSKFGPDIPGKGRGSYTSESETYTLDDNLDELEVEMLTHTFAGIDIVKKYSFNRNSYVIRLDYFVRNNSKHTYNARLYGRLSRRPEASSPAAFLGVQTFTGMALNTPEKPYQKLTFKEVATKPYSKSVVGGWAAMIERYFTAAWVPVKDQAHTYKAQPYKNLVGIEFIGSELSVEPNSKGHAHARLYAGPQVAEDLQALSPGLQLTADYGILWPVCQPIFWLLKRIQSLVGNWGVSIILVTLTIKLLFFKLSAASFKSMAKMRLLQPKMTALKERFGDDKQKFGQAVMELYKKEKINPVGGCLPTLVQIPVFISLYYVLLGSVELHNAPFMLWIQDLSTKDPYYVLPILMGMSMFLQQKFSPAPADPMQAKVMMFMPLVFTFMFFQFPAGLVLYWLANNLLSILQQWLINRQMPLPALRHVQ